MAAVGTDIMSAAKSDISTGFDLGASGLPTNIARDKDRMIGEAVWKDYLRSIGGTRRGGRWTTKND